MRWHPFIEYRPGEDNEGADALSRWAYPAGEAQHTNLHGGDADLLDGLRHSVLKGTG